MTKRTVKTIFICLFVLAYVTGCDIILANVLVHMVTGEL